jgi:hypothetical protein
VINCGEVPSGFLSEDIAPGQSVTFTDEWNIADLDNVRYELQFGRTGRRPCLLRCEVWPLVATWPSRYRGASAPFRARLATVNRSCMPNRYRDGSSAERHRSDAAPETGPARHLHCGRSCAACRARTPSAGGEMSEPRSGPISSPGKRQGCRRYLIRNARSSTGSGVPGSHEGRLSSPRVPACNSTLRVHLDQVVAVRRHRLCQLALGTNPGVPGPPTNSCQHVMPGNLSVVD